MLDLMNWGTNLDAGSVRAGGLGLNDLQSYTTAEGASVCASPILPTCVPSPKGSGRPLPW